MESETVITNFQPSTSVRMLTAAGPVLWIAASYVDPGKWATAVEGGARFGFDLAWLVLIMNCGAMLCQYLSAQVAIATGKNLAQICSKEYDDVTSVLIGIGAEISMVALDFSMVLGTAYCLHVVFGIDIFNCVFLTGFDAVVFPLFTSVFGNPTAKVFTMSLASLIFVYFLFGVLISQPESPLPMVGGMINKLSGENAYALMGLLGANIMPHNFYLHSSVVQQHQVRTSMSKVAMCNDHFFAIFCIFGGIFLVNCTLIYLAANTFYTSGLVSLTLQDVLSLFDQVFRSSLASISLIVITFFSNQVIPLTWGLERQVITQDLFRLEIPGWLHRATIRIIAIIPALYCFWTLGVEGIFQVLVFTQVLVALLLPSSVIPLFRVASSKSIMGPYNVSFLVEVFALVLFVGMLGLKIVFVIEMIFGTSDWASNLKWNIGSGLYLMLMVAAFASLCLMLLLAATPLKSSGVGTQSMKWDEKVSLPASPVERDQAEISEVPYLSEKAMEKQESSSVVEKPVRNYLSSSIPCPDLILPETLSDSENTLDLTTIHENESEITFSKPTTVCPEVSAARSDIPLAEPTNSIKNESLDADTMTMGSKEMVAPTLKMEVDVTSGRDYESACKPEEEVMKDVTDSSQSLVSDGPGSFRSISGKSDDVGSGAGSLSRLAGLGRAARRQLTVILDEFWGQLFDFFGQATQEAKGKKLDVRLGVDSKVDCKSCLPPVQLENTSKQSTGYSPSTGGRAVDSFRALSLNNSLKQPFGQSNAGSPLGLRQSSSVYYSPAQLLDAYVRNSTHATLDSGERRYYSVHVPSVSDGYDQQPATIHGYNLRSYLGQIAREKGSDGLKSQLESRIQNSPLSFSSNSVDSYPRPLGPKPQSGVRHLAPPGFHNVPVSRNNSLKSERPSPALYSPEPVDYTSNAPNAKKFHSLPDISGLYSPQPDSPLSGNISQLDKSRIYFSRQAAEPTHSSALSWASPAVGRNDSSAKVCRDAFSLQFGSSSGSSSLWSKHPYEHFGVDKSASEIQDSTSTVNVEIQLLQSFRSCIIKLMKLEGADWLFKPNDGADEDIVARVAAREKILYEVETRTLDRKVASSMQIDEADQSKFMSVPNCGEGCVWGADLIISFGVWCIRRILDLSLMESRPELWGKYTYVLNRLQGVIDLAFSKPRSPMSPCFCLQLPAGYLQKPTVTPVSNGSLPPPPSPLGRGKFTTAAMLLETIKDVEMTISSRKGRTGTAAGDVAFPKGKENLASVLKRYKRRLSNKPGELTQSLSSSRKIPMSPP